MLALGFLNTTALAAQSGGSGSKIGGEGTGTDGIMHYAFVSIPVMGHVIPLKALAEELSSRGSRVSFALPQEYEHWMSDMKGLKGYNFISTGPSPTIANNLSSMDRRRKEDDDVYANVLEQMIYYTKFQRNMFGALKSAFQNNRPDILIVDRFAFAGFDVAEDLGIPLVINNPQLLLDIDNPPMHIPAPYFGMQPDSESVYERCLNPLQRWKFRVVMIETFRRVNANRREMAQV